MKKLIYLASCAILALGIVSCNKDTYRHQIAISYPASVGTLFADQTSDSVVFSTFDSYQVKSYGNNWIEVLNSDRYPSSAKINNSYYSYYLCTVKLKAQPNTTNACRLGYVDVRSYGNDWDQTARAIYYQLYWHNIMHPAPAYEYKDYDVVGCKYEQTDSFNQVVDTLRFQAYDKWTLSASDGSFITLPQTSGEAGYQTLLLSLSQNPTDKDRSTELTLKSDNGAQTVVKFTQSAKKEEK